MRQVATLAYDAILSNDLVFDISCSRYADNGVATTYITAMEIVRSTLLSCLAGECARQIKLAFVGAKILILRSNCPAPGLRFATLSLVIGLDYEMHLMRYQLFTGLFDVGLFCLLTTLGLWMVGIEY